MLLRSKSGTSSVSLRRKACAAGEACPKLGTGRELSSSSEGDALRLSGSSAPGPCRRRARGHSPGRRRAAAVSVLRALAPTGSAVALGVARPAPWFQEEARKHEAPGLSRCHLQPERSEKSAIRMMTRFYFVKICHIVLQKYHHFLYFAPSRVLFTEL